MLTRPHPDRWRYRLLTAVALLAVSAVALPAVPAAATALGREGVYRFAGGGYGHGVGMSQYGAKGYAQAGWGAEQILRHYYTGTAVATRSSPTLRVWLADHNGVAELTTSGPLVFTSDSSGDRATLDTTTSGASPVGVVVDQDGISLIQGNTKVFGPVSGPITVRMEGSPFGLCGGVDGTSPCVRLTSTGQRYRFGLVELSRLPGTSTVRAVVRELPMERYLYGLGEMPSSWPVEALKAQAIAGRSYALDRALRLGNRRAGCDCTLYRTTADQNYVGVEKEAETGYFPRWRDAVDSTAGRVVTYGASVITALYSSSSGGWTAGNDTVFGSAPLPYLRPVRDDGDGVADNSNRAWSRGYRGSELETWLNADPATRTGSLSALEIRPPYDLSGRPRDVRIVGSAATKTVLAEKFRTVVNNGLRAAGRADTLRSTYFQIAYEPYDSRFGGGVFVGGGTDGPNSLFVTGPDGGGGPDIRLRDMNGSQISQFWAYDRAFTGGVRVAVCQDAAGNTRILTGPGTGGGPDLRLWTARGQLLLRLNAYEPSFTGGIYVACADVDGVPGDELVVGPGHGRAPLVRLIGMDGALKNEWYAYDPAFGGGVRVAAGDVHGDARADVVTAPGRGGGPDVRVYTSIGPGTTRLGHRTSAYDPAFTGGVYVATVTGSPKGAVITGAGEGGGAHVRAYRTDGAQLLDTIAFGGVQGNGVRVGGAAGAVLAASGPGSRPLVRHVP